MAQASHQVLVLSDSWRETSQPAQTSMRGILLTRLVCQQTEIPPTPKEQRRNFAYMLRPVCEGLLWPTTPRVGDSIGYGTTTAIFIKYQLHYDTLLAVRLLRQFRLGLFYAKR